MSAYYIQVDGPATLYIGPSNCEANGTPEIVSWGGAELGITESGVQVSINTMTHRINSDDRGGSEGTPAEMLIMGGQATIRGTLVKYSPSAFDSVASGLYNNNSGTVPLPGTPLFAGNYGFSLLVIGFQNSFYFPKCEMASQPREFNISSTERKTSFSITAYPIYLSSSQQGVIYYQDSTSKNIVPACDDAYGGSISRGSTSGS